MRLILASQSPRRRELIRQLGISFICRSSSGEEKLDPNLPPEAQVVSAAEQKALAVAPETGEDWVLGADTMVVLEGRMLGKPKDEADAEATLTALSGTWHEVMTGLALRAPSGRIFRGVETTRVHFVPMKIEEIRAYIATGDPMDKAGAYGIQSGAGPFIDRIEGCYYNVMGLPVARLRKLIETAIREENGL